MAAVLNVTPQEFTDWLGKLGRDMVPAVKRGMVSGAMRAIPLLQRRTEEAPPASPLGGPKGAFNTGAYRRGWRSEPLQNGVQVYNQVPYSGVIEAGRRPSPVNRDGIENLTNWARRKLKLSSEEARGAAFAIAKTLAKRRLNPRYIMSGASDELERLVIGEVERELDAQLARRA